MIVGIGVDVLEIARMERELRRDPDGLRAELFSAREIADCDARRSPTRHYATRFAAKEALFKALDAGDRDGSWWRQVEVRLGAGGEPELRLSGRVRELADRRQVRRVFVSLSLAPGIAAAAVVLEGDAPGHTQPRRERHSP